MKEAIKTKIFKILVFNQIIFGLYANNDNLGYNLYPECLRFTANIGSTKIDAEIDIGPAGVYTLVIGSSGNDIVSIP